MLSITKELKNIPISISILHEQEYDNLCNIYKFNVKGAKVPKRRAHSEKSDDKNVKSDRIQIYSERPHSQSQINKAHLKN
jgi:hypothetical protein